eukprot:766032-Hanusia_phi.AAC.2
MMIGKEVVLFAEVTCQWGSSCEKIFCRDVLVVAADVVEAASSSISGMTSSVQASVQRVISPPPPPSAPLRLPAPVSLLAPFFLFSMSSR